MNLVHYLYVVPAKIHLLVIFVGYGMPEKDLTVTFSHDIISFVYFFLVYIIIILGEKITSLRMIYKVGVLVLNPQVFHENWINVNMCVCVRERQRQKNVNIETQQESEPVHLSVCMMHRKMVNVHFPHTATPLDPEWIYYDRSTFLVWYIFTIQ